MASLGKRFCCALFAVLVAGCAVTGHDRITGGDVALKTVPSATAAFFNVSVITRPDGKTVVAGNTIRRDDWRMSRGEVRIDLFDRNGKPIGHAKAAYTFRRSRAKVARLARFSTELPVSLPAGSTMVIRQHYPYR